MTFLQGNLVYTAALVGDFAKCGGVDIISALIDRAIKRNGIYLIYLNRNIRVITNHTKLDRHHTTTTTTTTTTTLLARWIRNEPNFPRSKRGLVWTWLNNDLLITTSWTEVCVL